MRLKEGAVPAPAEALLLAVGAAPQQQQPQSIVAVRWQQVVRWHPQGAQLRFQQAQATVALNALHDHQALAMLQHGWGWNPRQLPQGDFRQGDRKIQIAEQLPQVEQVEPRLALQQAVHLITDVVAQERDAVMQGQGLADGHRDVPGAAGTGQLQHLWGDRTAAAEGCNLIQFRIQGGDVGVRQPKPALLEGLTLKLQPLATAAGAGMVAGGPEDAVEPLVPMFQLLRPCRVGVGLPLQQRHRLDAGPLL